MLLPRVELVETLAAAGFDAVVFDLEHGAYAAADLPPLVAAAQGAGVIALTRVADRSGSQLGRALDAGVDGVIVPHVSTAGEASAAVDATRYPPAGSRSVNPYVRGAGYGRPAASGTDPDPGPAPGSDTDPGTAPGAGSFLSDVNDAVALLVMVEGADGLAALDPIIAVEGVDGVFVGPVDLSGALGHPGEPEHPEVVEAVGDVLTRVAGAGVAPAVYAPTPAAARRWFELGASFVALSADLAMAGEGFVRYVKETRVSAQ